jgi:Domain of unknown function (DUF4394)
MVLFGLLAAALMLVSAPMVAYADDDDDDDRGSERDDRDGNGGGCGDLDVVGITPDNRLIAFESDDPRDADNRGMLRGYVGDTKLVGIDYRPSNGLLYGVGDQGGLYTVDVRTATAPKVGQVNGLDGTSFGVDVNPAADALRIISDTGQNLRYSFTAGTTTVDGPLTYPPATTRARGVTGAGYTNNDANANTATTLLDLDSTLDQTAIQSPANSGRLAATGKLGVDTTSTIGFDIYSALRQGTTTSLCAFASLNRGAGETGFYRINLLQGRATEIGSFRSRDQVTGIAIQLDR